MDIHTPLQYSIQAIQNNEIEGHVAAFKKMSKLMV